MKSSLIAAAALLLSAGGALAADFQQGTVDVPAPAGWGGVYVGANVGYGPGTVTEGGLGSYKGPAVDTYSFAGYFAGAQLGYNFMLNDNLVLGVEANGEWTNESGGSSALAIPGDPTDHFDHRDTLNWTAAATAHLGVVVDGFMPYVLAGAAVASSTNSLTEVGPGFLDSLRTTTKTHIGYVVGAGLASQLGDHLTGFVEGRYANYGSQDYNPPDAVRPNNIALQDATVAVGLNYHP